MSQDYWNEAVEQTTGPKMYFGQIFTDSFPVRILKGSPKVLFDPNQHPAEQRFIQIKVDGVCTKADGSTYTINREMVAKLDRGWNIIKTSVKMLGTSDPNEKWARWEMVEDGSSWTSKTTNELVKGTTFKFGEFYPDEATCRAAEAAFYRRPAVEPETDLDDTHPMPPEEDADKTRANLALFLPNLWAAALKDPQAFYDLIASQTETLAKHFNSNSPEVAAIVAGGAA